MVRCRGNPGDSRDTRFRKKENRQMGRQTMINAGWWAAAMIFVSVNPIRVEAQVLNELIGGAKKESEIAFTAGPSTFRGRQAFSELQAAFNKKFGLNARINFTAGPSMPAMAARIITEAKAGRRSSTDVHLGPPATQAELHNEGLLERVDYSSLFPWVTKGMEILPGETVLVYTSLQGILYNSNLLPKEQTPKKYEDLVEPKLSRSWAGKMASSADGDAADGPSRTAWVTTGSAIPFTNSAGMGMSTKRVSSSALSASVTRISA